MKTLNIEPEIDLFASQLNRQVKKFCSINNADEIIDGFVHKNAFEISWKKQNYANPPWTLIDNVLEKVVNSKVGKLVLVAPLNPLKAKYQEFFKKHCTRIIRLPNERNLFIPPGCQRPLNAEDRLEEEYPLPTTWRSPDWGHTYAFVLTSKKKHNIIPTVETPAELIRNIANDKKTFNQRKNQRRREFHAEKKKKEILMDEQSKPTNHERKCFSCAVKLSNLSSNKRRIKVGSNRKVELLVTSGNMKGKRIKILIDTGASGNFMKHELFHKLHLNYDSNSEKYEAVLADGKTLYSAAYTNDLEFTIDDKTYNERFMPIPMKYDLILGMPWLEKMCAKIDCAKREIALNKTGNTINFESLVQPTTKTAGARKSTTKRKKMLEENRLVNAISLKEFRKIAKRDKKNVQCFMLNLNTEVNHISGNENENKEHEDEMKKIFAKASPRLKKLLEEYEDLFKPLNGMPPARSEDMKIETEDHPPPKKGKLYHLSPEELAELKIQLAKLLKLGYIRPSTSEFGAPIFFVKQPGKLRMVVDYRALNKITVPNRASLPHIREMLDQLQLGTIFSKFDLQSGFHQIRIKETDIHKTAFTTKYGHFEWTVMPFGLRNCPGTFQNIINDAYQEFLDDFLVAYIDDLLIYSKNEEEHYEHLEKLFERTREKKLRFNIKKSEFLQQQVKFLGYLIEKQKIAADPERLKSIVDAAPPRTVTELRSFLGVAVILTRFMKDYAKLAAPLTDMLKGTKQKTDEIIWTDESKEAFKNLKIAVKNCQPLHIFDPTKPVILHTDWCQNAVGGWISQLEDKTNEEIPIAFNSKKMTNEQRNYSPYQGELYGIIWGLKTFRPYLSGRKVYVKTDQRALRWLMDQPELSTKQHRYIETLMEFDLEIEWIRGTWNSVADGLSRMKQDRNKSTQTDLSNSNITDQPNSDLLMLELNNLDDEEFVDSLKELTQTDEYFTDIIDQLKELPEQRPLEKQDHLSRFKYRNNILYYDDRICVPQELRLQVLEEFHNTPYGGHPGFYVTYELISRDFWWPGINKTVKTFTKTCDECQKYKYKRHKPHGLLNPLSIPDRNWESIAVDFIFPLPTTTNEHNAITVFICRRSKMIRLATGKTTDNASNIARQYIETVFRNHGLQKTIVTDHDGRFNSDTWKEILKSIGTSRKIATPYHHETAGQVENLIGHINSLLKIFCAANPTNWDQLLPILEFSINNRHKEPTQLSPFFINTGQHPIIPGNIPNSDDAPAQLLLEEIQGVQAFINDCLHGNQLRMTDNANRNRKQMHYSVDDSVLLSAKDIFLEIHRGRQQQRTHKFDPLFIGPYRILEVLPNDNYRLELPAWLSKIHPIFHVSKLERYNSPTEFDPLRSVPLRPEPEIINDEEEYEPERILQQRTYRGRREYYVKWKNYPIDEATWENHLEFDRHAHNMVTEFHQHQPPLTCTARNCCNNR